MSAETPLRLTSLAHGGGCGCKRGPPLRAALGGGAPRPAGFPDLLVGAETSDDAAVWRLDDERGLVSTTDFFTPIVDDPFHFGQIAATNALSDVWAMGGRPIFALALLGMPIAKLPPAVIAAVLAGGAAACAAAGVPIAGGHSIDSAEPIYGLAVNGLVPLRHLRRNSGARAGDRLVLAKPLGVGVLSAAFKKGLLDDDGYATLLRLTTTLNAVGAALAAQDAVHAMTDVTGFGLLGHLSEVARGAGRSVWLDRAAVPVLPLARRLRAEGLVTGASGRNWLAVEPLVAAEAPLLPPEERDLLCDPQTAGPLLISVGPEGLARALDTLAEAGFAQAAEIGVVEGEGAALRWS
jgi:selenide,water dikinase